MISRVRSCQSSCRSSALVLTLFMVSLITILVVGFVLSMRSEILLARSHVDGIRATLYAQVGNETALARMQTVISDTNRGWASQPGRLLVSASNTTNTPLTNIIELSSGIASDFTVTGSDTTNADLNIPTFGDPGRRLLGPAIPMRVRWVYVRKNGTHETNSPPPFDALNPVVGRYGFWVDDQSSRINVNTAWTRAPANANQLSHPTRVALKALSLTDGQVEAIRSSRTARNFFNTPEEARSADSAVSAVLATNLFNIAHYNYDPDTTFFNEDRIVLTTKSTNAVGRARFLDICISPDADPGLLDNVSDAKLRTTLVMLQTYLQRSDWPFMTNSASFQQKFYANSADRLTQLSLNIIDYVRSKESTNLIVEPIRGGGTPATFTKNSTANLATSYIGITRAPCINEIGVFVGTNYMDVKFKVELFLPRRYGIDSTFFTASDPNSYLLFMSYWIPEFGAGMSKQKQCEVTVTAADAAPFVDRPEGRYITITKPFVYTSPADWITTSPGTNFLMSRATNAPMRIRTAFSKAGAKRLDVVPLIADYNNTYTNNILYTPDATNVALNNIHSVEVDDPRVNKHQGDWKERMGNSFGQQNLTNSVGKVPIGIDPQQDTDAAGTISSASLYMPSPKGTGDNLLGRVTSPAELGYIHTGMESSSKPGTPWRTLRLQPQVSTSTNLPDWALMDLFSVPVNVTDVEKPVFQPYYISTNSPQGPGGRVNLNSKIQPFSVASVPLVKREQPLKAVAWDAPKSMSLATTNFVDETAATAFSLNVRDHVLSSSHFGNQGKHYGNTNIFDSPGEIVEIAGVADEGEETEAFVREIANLVTTRGSVFSVYSIGQAVRQSQSGVITVTAEKRTQSILQCYRTAVRNGVRTLYYRDLSP